MLQLTDPDLILCSLLDAYLSQHNNNEKIPISHEFINEFLYKENELQLCIFLVHIRHPTNVHRCHESGNRVQFITLFFMISEMLLN